jgi:hypothetical protein
MFRPLTGLYEPSAIQQLTDGRFIVAEDEKEYPFSLVILASDGSVDCRPLELGAEADAAGLAKLGDLEGLTGDAAGFVYAITSHSRNSKGEEKKSRERLLRFRVDGSRLVAPAVVTNLKAALVAAQPLLASAAAVLDVKNEGGLNIEALEMTPDGRRLLLGFRSPLVDGRAILASIDNPDEVFASAATPAIASTLVTLDLAGHGLRALAWIPALTGYLLISGPVARELIDFRLWFWSGEADGQPRRVAVAGLPGFAHAEGIGAAIVAGHQKVVVVSDDGSRAEGRAAGFLLLDPNQLQIA